MRLPACFLLAILATGARAQAPADPFEVTFRTLPAGGTGTVSRKTFTPPSLGYIEDYNLYLPPGHGASPTQKYPAIYLLHGGFGDWSSWNSGGVVQQIYFREGEMVGASRPVAAILPPDNVKIRFYVREGELPKIGIGEDVHVACDGCAANLSAKVYFIAGSAEYTPPVIYSESERSKLVYLVQARPAQPGSLRIGQPVTVTAGE